MVKPTGAQSEFGGRPESLGNWGNCLVAGGSSSKEEGREETGARKSGTKVSYRKELKSNPAKLNLFDHLFHSLPSRLVHRSAFLRRSPCPSTTRPPCGSPSEMLYCNTALYVYDKHFTCLERTGLWHHECNPQAQNLLSPQVELMSVSHVENGLFGCYLNQFTIRSPKQNHGSRI